MADATGSSEDALVMAAVIGGAVAGLGGFVRVMQTPMTQKQAFARTLIGMLFGACAAAFIEWWYPTVPLVIAVLAGGCTGFMTAHISEGIIKILNVFEDRLKNTASKRMDKLGMEPESTPTPGKG